MKRRLNRLSPDGDHRLKGSDIDRSRSFTFRLDGREVPAFRGDTLLTAAIAAGVVGAGTHEGRTIALDERFSPSVLLRGTMHDPAKALSLARTPAAEGLDLVTIAQARRPTWRRRVEALRSAFSTDRWRLRLDYDDDAFPADPWFDAPPTEHMEVDVAVVGGGLAGLAAALAAGRRGGRVVLIERRSWLGGDCRFFGATGDEESPEDTVLRLTTALRSLDNVTIWTSSEAFALFEGSVRVNRVMVENGVPYSRTLTLNAPRIVLATGCIERLPVFPGNRLPGVVGSVSAFHRADRFGVWIGQRAVLSTAVSVAYRVATLAKDAGVEVTRIADTRINPQSRFVEFGKAYGIPLARSVQPRAATPAGRRGELLIELHHEVHGAARDSESFAIDQFVVAGGWQPDLSLWHMAGGSSRWHAARHRLEAEGSLEGVLLAGSAVGFASNAAVQASGQAVIATLFGRDTSPVDDNEIDELYETPDDPAPIAAIGHESQEGAYLDGGTSLALRPSARPLQRIWSWRRQSQWGFAEQPRPLGVADVAAGIDLGVIPASDAAIVAQERCVTPGDLADAGHQYPVRAATRAPAEALSQPPAYLAGRFGARTTVWSVEAMDGRDFEVGCLVHLNADAADPLAAVGVVFAAAPSGRKGGLAALGKWPVAEGDTVAVRDISGSVPARLIDPLRPIDSPFVVEPIRPAQSAAAPDAGPAARKSPDGPEAAIALLAGAADRAPPAASDASPTAAIVEEPAEPAEAPAIGEERAAPTAEPVAVVPASESAEANTGRGIDAIAGPDNGAVAEELPPPPAADLVENATDAQVPATAPEGSPSPAPESRVLADARLPDGAPIHVEPAQADDMPAAAHANGSAVELPDKTEAKHAEEMPEQQRAEAPASSA